MLEKIRSRVRVDKEEDLLLALGKRKISLKNLLRILFPKERSQSVEEDVGEATIVLDDIQNVKYEIARCCKPIPGDEIYGVLTRAKGLVLHEAGCPNLKNVLKTNPEKVRRVELKGGGRFKTDIRVVAKDRIGLLSDIAKVLSEHKANIVTASTITREGLAILDFTLDVRNREHLMSICENIKRFPEVEVCRRLYR